VAGDSAKLAWEVHGESPTGIIVERRIDSKETATWEKVAQLTATESEYADASYRRGLDVSYRVRAINAQGTSVYSNIVRLRAQR